jgi:hypothetical protein
MSLKKSRQNTQHAPPLARTAQAELLEFDLHAVLFGVLSVGV